MILIEARGEREVAGDISEDTDNEDGVRSVIIADAKDWFLQSTIESVIAAGVEIGVTLTVGGAVVSGTLISGKTYFKELGEVLAGASQQEGDMQSVLGSSWSKYSAIYEKPEDAPEDWRAPPAGFIHLRDARYYAPGQGPLPSNQGVLWRGKLSAVDAFSVGSLSTS